MDDASDMMQQVQYTDFGRYNSLVNWLEYLDSNTRHAFRAMRISRHASCQMAVYNDENGHAKFHYADEQSIYSDFHDLVCTARSIASIRFSFSPPLPKFIYYYYSS